MEYAKFLLYRAGVKTKEYPVLAFTLSAWLLAAMFYEKAANALFITAGIVVGLAFIIKFGVEVNKFLGGEGDD